MRGGIVGRRTCLRAGAGAVPALSVAAAAGGSRAAAQAKLSQQEAGYQDTPKEIQTCGSCTLFIPPDACKVVEGRVSVEGWCRLYDMVD